MDCLRSCYQSYMRLFPEDPDRLTLGRWRWCPEGALPLPFPHAFCSSVLDPDQWGSEYPLGEVPGIVGPSKGTASIRYTGQRYCGAKTLWQQGSPLDLEGTPPVDEEGVPFCCKEVVAVGGLAADGVGGFWNDREILLWLRPESLDGFGVGAPIDVWEDSAVNGLPFTAALGAEPVKQLDTEANLSVAVFGTAAALNRGLNLDLGGAYSLYMVGLAGLGADRHAGPWVIGGSIGSQRIFRVVNTAVTFSVAGYTLIGRYPQSVVGKHIYAGRFDGSDGEITVDGAILAVSGPGPVTHPFIAGLSTAVITLPQTRTSVTGELLVFGTKLTDTQHQEVLKYLSEKWLIPLEVDDVVTGTILAYGAAPVPTGYLACNGLAVDRTIYANLFNVIGTDWGAGDGSTTFNVPDLRGRAGIGSGTGSGLSTRTLADIGGEEEHTLLVNELASHTHDVEYLNQDVNDTPVTDNVRQVTDYLGANDSQSGPAGADDPHNNMQPFAVVNYIIKT